MTPEKAALDHPESDPSFAETQRLSERCGRRQSSDTGHVGGPMLEGAAI
jgi:hypothetical protein